MAGGFWFKRCARNRRMTSKRQFWRQKHAKFGHPNRTYFLAFVAIGLVEAEIIIEFTIVAQPATSPPSVAASTPLPLYKTDGPFFFDHDFAFDIDSRLAFASLTTSACGRVRNEHESGEPYLSNGSVLTKAEMNHHLPMHTYTSRAHCLFRFGRIFRI